MKTRNYFGTDGVRGRANEGAITSEFSVRLGRALASTLTQNGRRRRVVIGKDTRLSGYMLETALASGIVSSGADVILVGPLPTPGIAYLTAGLRCDAGIVISASHNPYTDNGIKLFDRYGYKLPDHVEKLIESRVDGVQEEFLVDSPAIGYAQRVDDAIGRYIVFLKSHFPSDLNLDGLKVVVDCANGACYKVSPAVFEELGATVISMGVEPNGMNINEGVGALHPDALAAVVRKEKADVGIALDGDGDRVVLVDENGTVIDGDALLGLCAIDLMENDRLEKNTMVATSMSNLGLEHMLAARGATVIRSDVGDRYVMEQLKAHDLNFGGESSGHIIFRDYVTTGDGTLAALQVLAQMVRKQRTLAELAADFHPVPQGLVAVDVAERIPLDEVAGYTKLSEQAAAELGCDGRILIRYSGTEPKVRIMVESMQSDLVEKYLAAFSDLFQ